MAKVKFSGSYTKGVGSGGGSGKSPEKTPAQEAEERRQHAADVISKATNKQELMEAMRTLGLQDQTSFINEVKNFESAQRIASAVADMNAVWGVDGVGDVTTKGKFSGGVTGYRTVGKPEIHLNPKYYNDLRDLELSTALESAMGYSYKNESSESIVKHEYAHVLQDRLMDKNSPEYQRIETNFRTAQASLDRSVKKYPEEWKEAQKYLDRASSGKTMSTSIKNVLKAHDIMRKVMSPLEFQEYRRALNERNRSSNERVHYLKNTQMAAIQRIFGSIGAYRTPTDVASALTGNPRAYARTDWNEAHAECIADYMTNGRNASPVSIAYAQAFAREIGVNLP